MPNYFFQSEQTGEIKEIFYHMNDNKVYIEDNVEWKRLWTVPLAAVDSNIDVNNPKDFAKKTAKPGTMGEIWDRSAEWSAKRADKNGGTDPIKSQYFGDYAKKRKGVRHLSESKEKLDKLNIKI